MTPEEIDAAVSAIQSRYKYAWDRKSAYDHAPPEVGARGKELEMQNWRAHNSHSGRYALGELSGLQNDYQNAGANARTQALEDAKRAGTYSGTPEFSGSLDYEAAGRARGAKGVELSRINALRSKVGLPSLPQDYTPIG